MRSSGGWSGFQAYAMAADGAGEDILAVCIHAPRGRPSDVSAAFFLAFAVAFAHATPLGLLVALSLVHERAFRALPTFVAGGVVGAASLWYRPASLLFPWGMGELFVPGGNLQWVGVGRWFRLPCHPPHNHPWPIIQADIAPRRGLAQALGVK